MQSFDDIEIDIEMKTKVTSDDAYTMTVHEDPDDSVFGVFYKAKVILTLKNIFPLPAQILIVILYRVFYLRTKKIVCMYY